MPHLQKVICWLLEARISRTLHFKFVDFNTKINSLDSLEDRWPFSSSRSFRIYSMGRSHFKAPTHSNSCNITKLIINATQLRNWETQRNTTQQKIKLQTLPKKKQPKLKSKSNDSNSKHPKNASELPPPRRGSLSSNCPGAPVDFPHRPGRWPKEAPASRWGRCRCRAGTTIAATCSSSAFLPKPATTAKRDKVEKVTTRRSKVYRRGAVAAVTCPPHTFNESSGFDKFWFFLIKLGLMWFIWNV